MSASSAKEKREMRERGLEDVVAIMIPEPKGKEIVSLLERNITVMMYITIGTRNLQKYVSRTSVVFVSISFIVLMIISLAWLVFYYIQRFRYANARDRNQETEPDFDNCAVCIEGYKPNDVVRILPCRHLFHKSCVDPWLLDHRTCPMCKMNILKALGIPPNADCMDDIPPDLEASIGGPPTNQITGASDITVNESSVALDPPARTVGVLQVIQDVDSFPQAGEGNFTTSNRQGKSDGHLYCTEPRDPYQCQALLNQSVHTEIVTDGPTSKSLTGADTFYAVYEKEFLGIAKTQNVFSDEQEPAVSSDSDISLIMAMEVGLSDVELSTDQDCEEAKS
ncbi:RING finger protein 150 [Willisornis vidua]|uniref:RING finger protein 150 n=1 Tax=Willisornis vidua TaxID=1566151 RepID=A0ABQ9DL14_9PASS|nr:RING finger protein 150 [Willisornis vidua]